MRHLAYQPIGHLRSRYRWWRNRRLVRQGRIDPVALLLPDKYEAMYGRYTD